MAIAPRDTIPAVAVPARAGAGLPTDALIAVAILGVALLLTCGAIGLFEPTETRYAEIGREMLASGDYMVPHLNGIAHFHKPPITYWTIALSDAAFGVRDWAARVPVALATTAALAFAALAARRKFPALGAPGAVVWVLGTMALPFAIGRTIATDPFLAATVIGWWALAPSAWALAVLGLGFFIKGPVVLVPTILPVLVVAALTRSRAPLARCGPRRGWLAFAAMGAPWFLVASFRNHALLPYLVENQIWERYTTHVHHRAGPAWYFVLVMLAGTLPWTAAAAVGIARAWRERSMEGRLALAWVLAPLVFFSFSGSKLPAYVLPCFPALAMLAVHGLERGGRGVRIATAVTLVALAAAGALAGPRLVAGLSGVHHAAAAALPRAVYLGLAFWAYAAVWVMRGRTGWASAVVLLGWLALLTGLSPYEGPLGSPRPLARLLAEHRTAAEPIVEYHRFNAGLPFYLGTRVRLLDVERELFFTPPSERDSILVTRDSLVALAAERGRVWMLAPGTDGAVLADSLGLAYTPFAKWQRESLGWLAPRVGGH